MSQPSDPIVQCSAEERRHGSVDYCILEAGHGGSHQCHFGHRWERSPE